MTNKELLELAAKAAGYKGEYQNGGEWMNVRYGFTEAFYVDDLEKYWNPLIDDGDALRLAVNLGLNIDPTENFMVGEFAGFGEYEKATDVWFVDPHTAQTFSAMEIHKDSDPYEATRRAIVRAAAEIGKEMK
jgi:hypothetical protein